MLGSLLAAAYYGLFCYQTTLDALKATRELETVMSNMIFYVWPNRWALCIGSGALVAAIFLNAVDAMLTGRVEEPQLEEESQA